MESRFWSKVNKTDTCWLWTAGTWNGYGRYRHGARNVLAHKALYESVNGRVLDGHELDHLCGVRHCVRPDHLEAVTHAENVRRGNGGSKPRARCPQGHDYSIHGRMRRDGRGRRCVICHASQLPRTYPRGGDHCGNGHERTDVNAYRNASGKWICRVCNRNNAHKQHLKWTSR